MLCETCVPVFTGEFKTSSLSERHVHHADLASFTEAAGNGCYVCQHLLNFTMSKTGDLKKCLVAPQLSSRTNSRHGSDWRIEVDIEMTILEEGHIRKYTKQFRVPEVPAPAPELGENIIETRKLGLPLAEAVKSAQRWMKICLEHHEECPKQDQPSSYPTRLLELTDSTVRLILPAETPPSGPYAALSYCWGPHPSFLRLTRSNLPKLQASIPNSDLPIAFQEMIGLLKNLNIHYLWIDSLCIIQSGDGSSQDWQSESAKMQNVYSDCILNLSLSRVGTPDHSCLNGWTPATLPPFHYRGEPHFAWPSLDYEPTQPTYTILCLSYFKDALEHQPLGLRGWVLQERLLATRVLSFGHGELFWDCNQLQRASESLPSGSLDRKHYDRFHDPPLSLQISPTSSRDNLTELWHSIVDEYSQRLLTYPERDKLVALSAIASRLSVALDTDTYVAGHFWKTLPRSLNWRIKNSKELNLGSELHTAPRILPATRRIPGCARNGIQNKIPTWSWASIDGPVSMSPCCPYGDDCLAEAEEYSVVLMDQNNPFGEVISATLTISAYCTEMIHKDGLWRLEEWGRADLDLNISWDFEETLPERETFLLAALVRSEWEDSFEGLILKKVELDGLSMYERVGSFRTRSVWDIFKQERRRINLV